MNENLLTKQLTPAQILALKILTRIERMNTDLSSMPLLKQREQSADMQGTALDDIEMLCNEQLKEQ